MAANALLVSGLLFQHERNAVALTIGVFYAGAMALTLSRELLVRREREARLDLARANAELSATRELLAQNARAAERLNISRDLHDALGHHLTALSMQLEVATRRANAESVGHLREAHAIARLLLSDLRSVVGELRADALVDLSQVIRETIRNLGDLRVHLDMPQTLLMNDASQADAVLRCVQEVITNSARHSGAKNLRIEVLRGKNELTLQATDDGRGANSIRFGHGLTGIQERVEKYGGRIEVSTRAGNGFKLRAVIPLAESA